MIKRTMMNLMFGSAIIAAFGSCGTPNNSAIGTNEQTQEQEVKGIWENIDVSSFEQHMNDEGAVVVDVRTDGELAEGMISNAVQIEFNSAEFNSKFEQLDKNSPVLVYCASGGRSGKTLKMLKDMGFQTVYNLEGGIGAWTAARMPVIKP